MNIRAASGNGVGISGFRGAGISNVCTINSVVRGDVSLAPITVTTNHHLSRHLFGSGASRRLICSLMPAIVFARPTVNAVNLSRVSTIRRCNGSGVGYCGSDFASVCDTIARRHRGYIVGLIYLNSSRGIVNLRNVNFNISRVVRNFTMTVGVNTAGTSFSGAITVRPANSRRFIAVHWYHISVYIDFVKYMDEKTVLREMTFFTEFRSCLSLWQVVSVFFVSPLRF